MKILVACEESQEVCKAFRERDHEAYSCDILSCSYSHKHSEQHRGVFTTDRAKNRAKTFTGIAQAMAEQWGQL